MRELTDRKAQAYAMAELLIPFPLLAGFPVLEPLVERRDDIPHPLRIGPHRTAGRAARKSR